MKDCCNKFFSDPEKFGAIMLRLGFAFLFIFAGIAKLRMGLPEFAAILTGGEGNMATEFPAVVLQAYGYVLPIVEMLAGLLLLVGTKKHARFGFGLAALIYLSFIFGQAYDGNFAVVGNEYLPSMLALFFAFHLHKKGSK
jgi:uncharacterized membrane protein YphA (DoxX/SURF4 family)